MLRWQQLYLELLYRPDTEKGGNEESLKWEKGRGEQCWYRECEIEGEIEVEEPSTKHIAAGEAYVSTAMSKCSALCWCLYLSYARSALLSLACSSSLLCGFFPSACWSSTLSPFLTPPLTLFVLCLFLLQCLIFTQAQDYKDSITTEHIGTPLCPPICASLSLFLPFTHTQNISAWKLK